MLDWKKKREIRLSYDSSADVYHSQYFVEQNAKIKAALTHMPLKKTDIVLDLGCGTGILFEHIGKSVKLLVGLDSSSKILREAKKHIKQLPRAALISADADHVPFRNRVFDSAFAITLLQNMPNPLRTLDEMKRISKPHALIAVTGLKKKFSKKAFFNLLVEAKLSPLVVLNGELKGHVAVCRS
jgi:ubiquinone/menaquinone biosynthesis C-methylase UbiE